ncbi:MAG TPA: polysaccharide deacetylase family protein [Bacillota bacterium]
MGGIRSRRGRPRRRTSPARKRIVLRRTRPAVYGLVLIVALALGVWAAVTHRLPGFGPYTLYVDDIVIGQSHSALGRYRVPLRPLSEAAGIYAQWDVASGRVSIGGRAVAVRYVGGQAMTDLVTLARQLKLTYKVTHDRREVRAYSGHPLLPLVPREARPTQVYMDGALLTEKSVELPAGVGQAGEAGGSALTPTPRVLSSIRVLAPALGATHGRGPQGEVLFDGQPIQAYNSSGAIYVPVGQACSRKGVSFTTIGLGRYLINSGAPVLVVRGGDRPEEFKSVAIKDKLVALTFDDELVPETQQLLDILEEKKAPATFFVTGRSLAWQSAMARRVVADGFEFGNHTYDHTLLNQIGDIDEVRAQILGTRRAVFAVTGQSSELFRPPGGILTRDGKKAIAGSGQKLILWSVSVGDYEPGKKPETIIRGVLKGAKPGGIILLHNAPAATIAALPAIVDGLRAAGYRLVTVSELLAASANQGGGETR